MSNTYERTLEIVKTFISSKTGINKLKLTEETKIEDDVGMAGLDTISFYEDFFSEFQIVHEGFELDRYVTSENLELKGCFRSIFSKTYRQKNRTRNNTIRHLTHVVIAKKWFGEEI
jgi:hypothetical protein